MRVFRKLAKDRRGLSNIITFMILLPLLMGFVIAMAQLTIIGIGQVVVNNAAFEGARAGARTSSSVPAAVKTANAYGSSIMHDWNSKAKVKATSDGTVITVNVKYTFPKYAYFNMEGIDIGDTVGASSSQLIEDRP